MKHNGIQPFDSISFEVVLLSPDILLVSGGCALHVEALIDLAAVRALDSISSARSASCARIISRSNKHRAPAPSRTR